MVPPETVSQTPGPSGWLAEGPSGRTWGLGLPWGQKRGILSPLCGFRHRKTKTHSSTWEQSPTWGPVSPASVSHEVTARSGQPPCVSWVLIHPKSVAAFGPCLWLWLFGTPFPLTVPWPTPLSLRTQATLLRHAPPPSIAEAAPLALHPGARFPSLLSFLRLLQFHSCS